MNVEPKDDLGDRPLTKRELALQKKGIVNLSAGGLQEWTRVRESKEAHVRAAKARRSWQASRLEVEEKLRSLRSQGESQD